MVVCVELQKLGNGDGAANATANDAVASHKTFTSGFLPINWRRLMIFSGWQAHTKFKEKKKGCFSDKQCLDGLNEAAVINQAASC